MCNNLFLFTWVQCLFPAPINKKNHSFTKKTQKNLRFHMKYWQGILLRHYCSDNPERLFPSPSSCPHSSIHCWGLVCKSQQRSSQIWGGLCRAGTHSELCQFLRELPALCDTKASPWIHNFTVGFRRCILGCEFSLQLGSARTHLTPGLGF